MGTQDSLGVPAQAPSGSSLQSSISAAIPNAAMSWPMERCRSGSWIVCAGANPREKLIHDTGFGHYGVSFAKVSFEHEYSHMPEYGAKVAAEYAALVSALPDLLSALFVGRDDVGPWLSAALDDESVCPEFKAAILKWFRATESALSAASRDVGYVRATGTQA